jgi:hypothetical protein
MTDDGLASVSFDTASLRLNARFFTERYLKAAKESAAAVGKSIERDIEAAGEAAGLGRLGKAWTSTVYPEKGIAAAPTVVIEPNGGPRTKGALLAYLNGAKISGKRGQKMAIALPAAGPRFYGRGKNPVTPEEWERRTGLQLRPVKIGRAMFLVTDGVVGKKTGIVARAASRRRLAQGRKVETLFIFRLIDSVTVKKRFSIQPILRGAPGRLAADFIARANAINASRG